MVIKEIKEFFYGKEPSYSEDKAVLEMAKEERLAQRAKDEEEKIARALKKQQRERALMEAKEKTKFESELMSIKEKPFYEKQQREASRRFELRQIQRTGKLPVAQKKGFLAGVDTFLMNTGVAKGAAMGHSPLTGPSRGSGGGFSPVTGSSSMWGGGGYNPLSGGLGQGFTSQPAKKYPRRYRKRRYYGKKKYYGRKRRYSQSKRLMTASNSSYNPFRII